MPSTFLRCALFASPNFSRSASSCRSIQFEHAQSPVMRMRLSHASTSIGLDRTSHPSSAMMMRYRPSFAVRIESMSADSAAVYTLRRTVSLPSMPLVSNTIMGEDGSMPMVDSRSNAPWRNPWTSLSNVRIRLLQHWSRLVGFRPRTSRVRPH